MILFLIFHSLGTISSEKVHLLKIVSSVNSKLAYDICHKKVINKNDFRIHGRRVHKDKFACDICHKEVINKNDCRIHVRRVHKDEIGL